MSRASIAILISGMVFLAGTVVATSRPIDHETLDEVKKVPGRRVLHHATPGGELRNLARWAGWRISRQIGEFSAN
jgi:hypothetical protein